jgi:hypothetical protein
MQAPAIGNPSQLSSSPQPDTPQAQPPEVPPAAQAFLFAEQQAFIGLGLDIASGKTPVG